MEEKGSNTYLLEAKDTRLGRLEIYVHMETGVFLVLLDRKDHFIPLWIDKSEDYAFFYFDVFQIAARNKLIKKLTNIQTGDIIYL